MGPPPPPPPPPLPLPALPPPHPPQYDSFCRTAQRSSRMRNLNWDTIPKHSVLGKRNVWTTQQPLVDFELDTKRIEELFSRDKEQCLVRRGGTTKKSVRGLVKMASETDNVQILNSKKSMNIGILLKQFRRPPKDIVEAIKEGSPCFTSGKLRELCKLIPDDMEVKKLKSYSDDISLLNEADQFMAMLVNVPGYDIRLKNLLLREEFFPFLEEMKHSIAVMSTAANELLACGDLHSVIWLVLKSGNYMNEGGYAGSAIGFKMASLLKLVDTKANQPGMNFLHYVVMQAQQCDKSLLQFPEQLQHIGLAARIRKQEVEMDFENEVEKIREAKMEASKRPDLQHQMEAFLHMADVRLADVEASLQELDALSKSVAEYFCEDPASFKLEECCSIFHSFCERFERATRENHEREAAETRKRQQKERETLSRKAKRRSIDSAFSCDETESSSLESALTSFLSHRPSRRRPHVPMGSSTGVVQNMADGDLNAPADSKEAFCDVEVSKPRGSEECLPEAPPVDEDAPRRRSASKRGRCIDDKLVPRSLTEHSNTAEDKVMKEAADEKLSEMPELSTKILRFQDQTQKEHVTPDRPQPRGAGCISTPRQRGMREVDLALQTGQGSLGSPWTILSPRSSPHQTPHRRHSFSISRVDILEDGVWALPDTPVGSKPHGKSGTPGSDEQCSSASGCSSKNIAPGTSMRSISLTDDKETTNSFKLRQLFQRRTRQDNHPDRRPEGSGFGSFFRRFERNRAGTVG